MCNPIPRKLLAKTLKCVKYNNDISNSLRVNKLKKKKNEISYIFPYNTNSTGSPKSLKFELTITWFFRVGNKLRCG